jgi:hypothetical protein
VEGAAVAILGAGALLLSVLVVVVSAGVFTVSRCEVPVSALAVLAVSGLGELAVSASGVVSRTRSALATEAVVVLSERDVGAVSGREVGVSWTPLDVSGRGATVVSCRGVAVSRGTAGLESAAAGVAVSVRAGADLERAVATLGAYALTDVSLVARECFVATLCCLCWGDAGRGVTASARLGCSIGDTGWSALAEVVVDVSLA